MIFCLYSIFVECNEIISVLPYTEISASSHKNSKRRKSCMPDMGDLESSKGWCPRKQNGKIYMIYHVILYLLIKYLLAMEVYF